MVSLTQGVGLGAGSTGAGSDGVSSSLGMGKDSDGTPTEMDGPAWGAEVTGYEGTDGAVYSTPSDELGSLGVSSGPCEGDCEVAAGAVYSTPSEYLGSLGV